MRCCAYLCAYIPYIYFVALSFSFHQSPTQHQSGQGFRQKAMKGLSTQRKPKIRPLRTSNPRKPRANARGFFVPIESAQACLGRRRRAQKTAPPQECVAFWGCEQPLSRHRRPQGGNPSSAHQGAYGNAKQHYSTTTFNSTRGERHGSVEDIFQL